MPTPIGNLGDMTERALSVLRGVDVVAAEDTRHTGLLLQHFAISARLFALHDHNEQQKADHLLAKLQQGQSIVLVSDAGTPLIFYESTHRLIDSLADMATVLGASRYVVLARELTKTWESIQGAPVGELLAWVQEDENRRKGEMVLIVEGFQPDERALSAEALRTLELLRAELPLKKAAALAAEIHGVKKNALYRYALAQNEADDDAG